MAKLNFAPIEDEEDRPIQGRGVEVSTEMEEHPATSISFAPISDEEDRPIQGEVSMEAVAAEVDKPRTKSGLAFAPITDEEDRPIQMRTERVAAEAAVAEEAPPISISPVDMLFTTPEKLQEFQEKREAKREELQEQDWSGMFTQEYEEEYGEKPDDRLSVAQVAASPKALGVLQRYLTPRIGKEAANPEMYEDKEEFVQRYLSYQRDIAMNSLSFGQELGLLMDKPTKQSMSDAAMAYLLFDNMKPAGHGKDKFSDVVGAVGDYTLAAVTDPINLATAGTGFLVKQGIKALGTKSLFDAVKAKLAPILVGQGVETGLTVWDSANRQQAKIQTGLQEEFDFTALGIDALVGSVTTGAAELYGAVRAVKGKSAAEELDARLGTTEAERKLREETEEAARRANYDPEIGRRVREDLQRGTLWQNMNTADPTVVQPELKVAIQKNLTEALTDWANNNKEIAQRLTSPKDVRITDIVHDMIFKGDIEVAGELADALKRAGVTNEQFADAFRGSIEDAAKTLGSWGAFKRKLDGLAEADPELAKSIERMQEMPTGLVQDVTTLVQSGDRGLRSLLVTAPVTTMRNVIGNTMHLGLDTFTDLADNIIYNITYRKANGQGVGESIWESFKVAGENLARFGKQAEQDEVLNRVLKNHSSIENRLLNYVQDASVGVGDNKMSKVIDSLQYLNRAQDQFFRKAIFNNRVDFYLRRNKLGTLNEYLRDGKPIPKEILVQSMEESLDRTFSKQYKGTDAAASLIQVVEKAAPVSTYFIPFPRYTMNAMEFVYKHSPIGVVDTAYMVGKAEVRKEALSEEQLLQIQKRTVQSLTGTGMLYGFYKYAESYPDEEWNTITDEETGATSDISTVGPIAIYKMLATALFRSDNNLPLNMTLADVNEAITGLQLANGSLEEDAGVVLKALVAGEEQTQEETKFMEKLGFAVGSHIGRGLQPIAWLSDLISAIDTEEGIVRNRRALSEEGGFVEAATNTLKNRLPYFKQDLPPYVSATRIGDMTRFNPLGSNVTGFRQEPPRGLAEIELRKHGIPPWTVGPYTKDPVVRDMIVKEMQPYINIMMEEQLLATPRYMYANRDAQKVMIKNWMSEIITPLAREMATANEEEDTDAKGMAFSRIQRDKWMQLPKEYRNLVNEFRKDNDLPTVEQSHEYIEGIQEADQYRSLM